MMLVSPQPMETFPFYGGKVYVEIAVDCVGYAEGDVDRVSPQEARRLDLLPLYAAWSYTATTKEPT